MRLKLAIGLIGTTLFFTAPVLADNWDFSSPHGNLGTNSHTYTGSGGLTIGAFGFWEDGRPAHLYGKNSGSGETGVGIYRDPLNDHEISEEDYVNLDMSNLLANRIFGGTLTIESLQYGESFEICQGGSDSALAPCGAPIVGSSHSSATVTEYISWTGSVNDVFGITGRSHDVLISSFASNAPVRSTTPEPASLLLLGTGLAGLGSRLRKRRG